MAYYGQQQRKMQEGQFTQTIYGLIRDQKFAEAIQHLNLELQVCKVRSALKQVPLCLPGISNRILQRTGQHCHCWDIAAITAASLTCRYRCGCRVPHSSVLIPDACILSIPQPR
jgi:hypothetical protein